eukprot:gene23724-188_t
MLLFDSPLRMIGKGSLNLKDNLNYKPTVSSQANPVPRFEYGDTFVRIWPDRIVKKEKYKIPYSRIMAVVAETDASKPFCPAILIYHNHQGANHRSIITTDYALAARTEVETFQNYLKKHAHHVPRRVLFIVNPVAGQKKASQVFDDQILPLVGAAGINFRMIKTTRPGHATDIGKEIDLSTFDAVVLLSGDGGLHELINGIVDREDWRDILRNIAITPIPCGSANALSADLGISKIPDAIFAVIKGHRRPLDVMGCWQKEGEEFGKMKAWFLNFLYGVTCDVDFNSEWMRFLGEARFPIQGVYEVLRHRGRNYKCQMNILEPKDLPERRGKPCKIGDPVNKCQFCKHDQASLEHIELKPKYLPDQLCTPDPDYEWHNIEDTFSFFTCQNTAHITTSTPACPDAHPSDGHVDLCFIRGKSKPGILDLGKTMILWDWGTHVNLKRM